MHCFFCKYVPKKTGEIVVRFLLAIAVFHISVRADFYRRTELASSLKRLVILNLLNYVLYLDGPG